MAEITIRDAREEDIAALLGLWEELERVQAPFRVFAKAADADGRVEAAFRDALTSLDARLLVAEADGAPVGMALLHLERISRMSDEASVELSRVCVHPRRRGEGIGAALVEEATRFARERGARFLSAKTFARNTAARAFWERHGFDVAVEIRVRRLEG